MKKIKTTKTIKTKIVEKTIHVDITEGHNQSINCIFEIDSHTLDCNIFFDEKKGIMYQTSIKNDKGFGHVLNIKEVYTSLLKISGGASEGNDYEQRSIIENEFNNFKSSVEDLIESATDENVNVINHSGKFTVKAIPQRRTEMEKINKFLKNKENKNEGR